MTTPRKELLQQGTALRCEDAAEDIHPMIQVRQPEHIEHTARGPSARIPGAKHQAADARVHDCCRTHCTRLERYIQGRVSQTIAAQRASTGSQSFNLGMGGRVVRGDGSIRARSNNLAFPDQHCTHGDFPAGLSSACPIQGALHEIEI